MENLSNKNITSEEAYKNFGDPNLKTKFKMFFDRLKEYVNSRPRSNKRMIGAGLGTTPEHPLVFKRGGDIFG